MWKKIISSIVVIAFFLPQTTVFATDSRVNESVSLAKEESSAINLEMNTQNATDQLIKIKLNNTALIATDQSIKINTSIANINSNVFSNGNFEYNGSQLTLTKDCNTVGKCIVNSNYAQINKMNENVNPLVINNFSDKIKAKLVSNQIIIIEENKHLINSNSIINDMILKGDLLVKSPSLDINSYIIANGNITVESSLVNSNKDKPFILVSENGNIDITSSSVNLSGIIYAPNGTITINSANTNINGIIIAKNIVIGGSSCTVTDNPICTELLESFLVTNDDIDNDDLDDNYESSCLLPNLIILGEDVKRIQDINPLDDYDGDGLNYLEEFEYDTNPFQADTDGDGLTDYDEVMVYHTNPNLWDTDDDKMSDGTEIACGLNPLVSDTDNNGVLDCDETTTQNVRLDSVNEIDIGETLVAPEIEITGKGDYSRKLSARDIKENVAISSIESIVGHPFEIEHEEDLQFDSSTLSFKISDEALKNNQLENLAVAWYDYENNDLVLLDTTYSVDDNKISASTNHYSTYLVVNRNTYYNNMRIEDGQYDTEYIKVRDYIGYKWEKVLSKDVDYSKDIVAARNAIVFLADETNSKGPDFTEVKESVYNFCNMIHSRNININHGRSFFEEHENGVGILLPSFFNSFNEFKFHFEKIIGFQTNDNSAAFVQALGEIISFKKYYTFIEDSEYHTDIVIISQNTSIGLNNISKFSEMYKNSLDWCKKNNIRISVVANPNTFSVYNEFVTEIGGLFADINTDFSKTLEPLIDKMKANPSDGWVRLSNGSVVKLEKDPSLGDWTIDTDKDGIADLNELKSKTTKQIYNPQTKKMETFDVWTFTSNPAKVDTDGDTLSDLEDMNETQYDCVVVTENFAAIGFNTGHVWRKINCTAYDYLDNNINERPSNPILPNEMNFIRKNISDNNKINFSNEELAIIGFNNNEGSKFYLDKKSISTRETIFKMLMSRAPKYYKHIGVGNSADDYKEVTSYDGGGFWAGKILSEADYNFSIRPYCTSDFYDYVPVITAIAIVGGVIIATFFVIEVAPFIVANIQNLSYMWRTYGFQYTRLMYQTIGSNGVATYVQMDMMDGDNDIQEIALILAKELQKDLTDDSVLFTKNPNAKLINNFTNQTGKKVMINNKSDILVLGKYFGENDPNSYQNVAKGMNACYYNIPQAVWNDLYKKYGENTMWLINQRAMENQLLNTRQIIFSVDPRLYPGTFLMKEYVLLTERYEFPVDLIDGYYRIILR